MTSQCSDQPMWKRRSVDIRCDDQMMMTLLNKKKCKIITFVIELLCRMMASTQEGIGIFCPSIQDISQSIDCFKDYHHKALMHWNTSSQHQHQHPFINASLVVNSIQTFTSDVSIIYNQSIPSVICTNSSLFHLKNKQIKTNKNSIILHSLQLAHWIYCKNF